MGCLWEGCADFTDIFGQLLVALFLLRHRRLVADKLLRHLVEHVLTLLQIGGYALNRVLVAGNPAFRAGHGRFLLRQRPAFPGDGQLVDHHRQRDDQQVSTAATE